MEGCCDSKMTRDRNDRRSVMPAQKCGIVGATSLIITLGFVASSIARDRGVPEISTGSRNLVKKIQQFDQTLEPLVVEYHKSGNSAKFEPKIGSLVEQREKLVKKFLKSLASDRSDLNKEFATSDKKLETLYAKLAKLETKGSRMAIKKVNAAYDAEHSRLQLIRDALEESFVLSDKLMHYELPKNIGLPGSAVTELPIFEEGPFQGHFMHYTGTGYEAEMDKDGTLYLQVKNPDSDEVFKNKISIGPDIRVASRKLSVMGLVSPSAKPLEQPQQVVLQGFAEEYVQFVLDYKFMPTSVTVSGGYRVPIDLPNAVEFVVDIKIPPAEGALNKAELVIKVIKGGKLKRTRHQYQDSVTFNDIIKRAMIRGHWGPGEIEIQPKNTKERFSAFNHGSGRILDGYTFRYSPKPSEFDRRKGSVTLTFVPPRR